jgi:DNA-binding GntR family transcriptional regulator
MAAQPRTNKTSENVEVAPASKPGLSERVYDILRHRIYERQLLVGSKLNIDYLARELGVSATPVRDAINRLVAERLAVYEPYQGYSLAPPLTPAEVEKIMAVRELLEVHAAREGAPRISEEGLHQLALCIEDMVAKTGTMSFTSFTEFDRRDNDFHELIVRSAENSFLTESYQPINARTRMGRLYYANGATDAASVIREHRDVLDAYRRRDGVSAAEALSRHLRSARQRLSALMMQLTGESEALASELRNRKRDPAR